MTTSEGPLLAVSVSAFAEMVSDDSPVPGGGAVAGVVAGLGAALAAMAGRFAIKSATDSAGHRVLVDRAEELRNRCCSLADADARAYTEVAAAQRIPVDDGGDSRREAMAVAKAAAVIPPSKLADAAREIAEIGLELVNSGSPHLRSDAYAASVFASAAASVAAVLVRVNARDDDIRLTQAHADAAAAVRTANQAAGAMGLSVEAVRT
ncbi:cyclodeaminase/cyclohydrolase family protein [Mycobacterium sp. 21AC1]|uniref:cyclodeaminase/cyclohydrolase family protein n=1 Tax=[Mycobacterium] appelbergii TaxID=2939269 RepID=UPI002939098C|nr:cyclodeaminase/cyclohydrolase family protein [Mycobacterium sp. 21AC1]MDV3129946.1 cyclodeaminase/cyclohydrolase family protein [Mycobacterium sp. 21AC1]